MFEFLQIVARKILTVLAIPLIGWLNVAGYQPVPPAPVDNGPIIVDLQKDPALLGGSTQLPDTIALYTDTLQSAINSTQTTMTLSRGTYNNSATALASSTYGFIVDEGTSLEEIVVADCTGTTCTNMTRGIDRLTGTSTISGLSFAHRRGSSVKITTAPSVLVHNRLFQGIMGIPNPLLYSSAVATTSLTNPKHLVDVELLNYTAFNGAGVVNASTILRGVSELATGCEAASSTSSGGSGPLVVPAELATSTFNSATLAGCKVIAANNLGKIDDNFISTSTLLNNINPTLGSTTRIGSFPAYSIGKNIQVFSSTGTSTFTVPSGITKVTVEMVGPGGGGGGTSGATIVGGAGGAGGYCRKNVDVTGTSSIQVFVGTGATGGSTSGPAAGNDGTWTTFGTNGFYAYATGGTGGGANTGGGGSGGIGTNCDVNITGGSGFGGFSATGLSLGGSSLGGSSYFGSTGAPGSGGGGRINNTGAAGSNGFIIVTW